MKGELTMKNFCSVPIGYKDTKFGRKYDNCGKEAIYQVKNSDWYVCSNHKEYAKEKKWLLIELKSKGE